MSDHRDTMDTLNNNDNNRAMTVVEMKCYCVQSISVFYWEILIGFVVGTHEQLC